MTDSTASPGPGSGAPPTGGMGAWGRPGTWPPTEQPPAAATASPSNPGGNAGFTIWLMATVGGLGLFLLLTRHARGLESSAPSGSPMLVDRSPTPQAAPRVSAALPRGEAQMPRWLRPSVQAARYAEPGRYRRQADDEVDED